MNAVDVLLLTSRSEGSPNVVKESLACNRAVVSVDVGDVKERLAGIEGCRVSERDDVEELAAHLASVLARRCRIKGRHAVEALAEEKTTQAVIEVYRDVLRRR